MNFYEFFINFIDEILEIFRHFLAAFPSERTGRIERRIMQDKIFLRLAAA
jgi:hypothetical protein